MQPNPLVKTVLTSQYFPSVLDSYIVPTHMRYSFILNGCKTERLVKQIDSNHRSIQFLAPSATTCNPFEQLPVQQNTPCPVSQASQRHWSNLYPEVLRFQALGISKGDILGNVPSNMAMLGWNNGSSCRGKCMRTTESRAALITGRAALLPPNSQSISSEPLLGRSCNIPWTRSLRNACRKPSGVTQARFRS